MTPAPLWCDRYVGLPFVRDARGPEFYDCYGLVVAVLRDQFGREAPEPSDDRAAWTPVAADAVQPGDVLVFRGDELHVGLVVSDEWMLHARQRVGVELARWRRAPWAGLITDRVRCAIEAVPPCR